MAAYQVSFKSSKAKAFQSSTMFWMFRGCQEMLIVNRTASTILSEQGFGCFIIRYVYSYQKYTYVTIYIYLLRKHFSEYARIAMNCVQFLCPRSNLATDVVCWMVELGTRIMLRATSPIPYPQKPLPLSWEQHLPLPHFTISKRWFSLEAII